MKADQWVEIARRGRNHAVLVVSYMAESFRQRWVEKKMRWGFSPASYRQFDGARWFHQSDIDGYKRAISRTESKRPGYLLAKAREYEQLIRRIRTWGTKIARLNFAALSSAQLAQLFNRYVTLWMESNGFIYNYLFINDYLANEISAQLMAKQRDTERQSRDLFAMLTPIRKSEARLEKEAVVDLTIRVRNKKLRLESPQWQQAVQNHLKKFAHLNRYIYYGASYTRADITKRVRELLKGKNLQKATAELQTSASNEQRINQLIASYRFDQRTVLKIQAARWWSYVPSFWDETFIFHTHKLLPLWHEIAKRFSLTYDELVEMQYREIYDHLQRDKKVNSTLRRELHQRYKDSAVIFERNKVTLLIGQKLLQYRQRELAQSKTSELANIRELKGQSASPGKAVGRVSIVHSVYEVGKVKRGEVLVASATTPMHVPAMEKAVAIVTDEGGLLSHAAIVSRELGVPCVVGTKIATKALKDGDRVEVDANGGLVRKL